MKLACKSEDRGTGSREFFRMRFRKLVEDLDFRRNPRWVDWQNEWWCPAQGLYLSSLHAFSPYLASSLPFSSHSNMLLAIAYRWIMIQQCYNVLLPCKRWSIRINRDQEKTNQKQAMLMQTFSMFWSVQSITECWKLRLHASSCESWCGIVWQADSNQKKKKRQVCKFVWKQIQQHFVEKADINRRQWETMDQVCKFVCRQIQQCFVEQAQQKQKTIRQVGKFVCNQIQQHFVKKNWINKKAIIKFVNLCANRFSNALSNRQNNKRRR